MIGKKEWIIPDGYMNATKNGAFESHEAVCVLNMGTQTATITLTIYFEDRAPMDGFRAICEGQRTNHIRLDWLENEKGERVPRGVPYAIVVKSDVPIVAQHSRMDVSQPEMALMTTIPFGV